MFKSQSTKCIYTRFFSCVVFPYCTVPYYLYTPHLFAVCLCGGCHWLAHPPIQDILSSQHHNLINTETAIACVLCVSGNSYLRHHTAEPDMIEDSCRPTLRRLSCSECQDHLRPIPFSTLLSLHNQLAAKSSPHLFALCPLPIHITS